ncbi:MAG: L-carnitine dehydrogenase [Smithella sp. PtaU1.Bin162]|nr:MAG: L-carnitine dehydrogenase [Smithella sp. PtaU1.Bin162]
MKLENIKKIACIGAGVIGHSWACAFARGGYEVRLMDVNNDLLRKAENGIRRNYEVFVKNELINQDEVAAILKKIEMGTDISWAVEDADFCIESVSENIDLKKDIFGKMDQAAPQRAILASSTSGQPMTEIAKATKRPEKCVIIHPLNPPHIIPAVEVVKGTLTSDETVDLTVGLLKKIGRRPYVCLKEVPGFVMSRLLTVVLREALSLLKKGVATVEDIDTAINSGLGLRFGLMGVFEIHNLTASGGLENFFKNYSGFYRQIWADLEDMKDVTPELAAKAVEGIRKELGDRSQEDIIKWRDEKLLELMKIRKLI